MTLRAKPSSRRPSVPGYVEDPYAVTTDTPPVFVVPPENAAAHLRNALAILQGVNPMEQGAREINDGILAAEARVIKVLALVESGPVPQPDGDAT